jgi:hypothetical protein
MERLMLEQHRKRDEEAITHEMALKKTVQNIMGEQYRMEMEQHRTNKAQEYNKNREHENAYIQKTMADTDPERLKNEALVADRCTNELEGKRCER